MGLLERGVFFHVLMGFDDQLRSLSPGVFMLQERFKLMPDDSISRVLSHGDYDYKKHWVTTYVTQQRLVIFNATFRARLGHFLHYRLRGWLSRVTGRLRSS
jgi:CelD/BcsL family acetyltransferase involved in cellulose biosynthesis